MRLRLLLSAMFALAACGSTEEHGAPSGNATSIDSAVPPPGNEKNTPPVVIVPAKAKTSVCLVQDDNEVPVNRLRAIGTEPFWGARIEGRCVTYSHPDDQAGLRVWTRFSGSAEAGEWIGTYGAKPFVLRTRPQPDCSDGMSDRRYPMAVTLTVGGEQRQGCAEPL